MIIVTVQKQNEKTGNSTLIGRMILKETSRSKKKANYHVILGRKNQALRDTLDSPMRVCEVLEYPRKSYVIWKLIVRALSTLYPGMGD